MPRNAETRNTITAATGATVGHETRLWQMADALRGGMDAADFIPCLRRVPRRGRQVANPPFNVSDWGGERLREDKRWQYGAPKAGRRSLRSALWRITA